MEQSDYVAGLPIATARPRQMKKRPRDPNQLARSVVDLATGSAQEVPEKAKDAAAVALGKKGGAARARKLPKVRRSEIAKDAAKKRWASD